MKHETFTTGPADMDYPSTAQLPDGKLITAFYAIKSPQHDGYHIGSHRLESARSGQHRHATKMSVQKVCICQAPQLNC